MVRKADGARRRRRRRKRVKKEKLVLLASLFSYLVCLDILAWCICARLPAWAAWVFTHVCVFFVGVFLSWLWSCGQEGPRLQMWAGEQSGALYWTYWLQSDPISCHHRTTLSTVTAWPPKNSHAPPPHPSVSLSSLRSLFPCLIPEQIHRRCLKGWKVCELNMSGKARSSLT